MADRERTVVERDLEAQIAMVGAGLLWFGILEWLIAQPPTGRWGAALVALLVMIVGGWWLSIRGSRWLLVVHLFVVLFSSGTALLFVTNRGWQHSVAIVGAGLVTAAFRQAIKPPAPQLRGRLAAFAMTLVMWFGWVTILSVNVFTNLSNWWLMWFGAILTTAVAIVVWAEADVPWRRFARWLPLWTLLGAEMTVVIWWLPTSIFVSSVVATTLLMLFLQTVRHYWLETWSPDRGRRYLTVGGSIIVAVLLTARWI